LAKSNCFLGLGSEWARGWALRRTFLLAAIA
jgi:hypothetical protein